MVLCSLLFPDPVEFQLQNGDLIFQESTGSQTGKAIKSVTESVGDYHFTHVGMVYIDHKADTFVIEATHPVVSVTPLREYLYPPKAKSHYPNSVVGRLKPEFRHCIPLAIEEGLALLGKPYDDGYDLENDAYYCSELIYRILKRANGDIPLFPLNRMTFKAPGNDAFLPEWVAYFKRLGLPIPEGKPGINPGAMSRSEVIEIVHVY